MWSRPRDMRAGWPPLEPDELLSSYLVRSAQIRGLSAQSLVALNFPGSDVWNRDIDANPPDSLLLQLAQATDCELTALRDMTLVGMGGPTETLERSGVRRWVNAIGVYHRLRTRYGLCYCPVCLDQMRYFDRHWRLSYWTVCPVHGLLLRDACPHCDAPLAPHRQQLDICRCANCHQLLTSSPFRAAISTDSQGALTAAMTLPAIHRYQPCLSATGQDYCAGMHLLLSAFLDARVRCWDAVGHARDRIELRRIHQRHLDLQLLDEIVCRWPYSMLSMAQRLHLTQRSFRQPCPDWVAKQVRQLPLGRMNGLGSPSLTRLRQARAAQLGRGLGWRTIRAQILIDIAGKRDGY